MQGPGDGKRDKDWVQNRDEDVGGVGDSDPLVAHFYWSLVRASIGIRKHLHIVKLSFPAN